METPKGRLTGRHELLVGQKLVIQNETNPPCPIELWFEIAEDGTHHLFVVTLDPPEERTVPKGEIIAFPAKVQDHAGE